MTIQLTLNTAGLDTGPFNIYSNVDNYTVAFATNISKATLLAGYTTIAPDNTKTARILSTGTCISSVDIVLPDYVPPVLPCTEYSISEISGTTDYGNFIYKSCAPDYNDVVLNINAGSVHIVCSSDTITSTGDLYVTIIGPCA